MLLSMYGQMAEEFQILSQIHPSGSRPTQKEEEEEEEEKERIPHMCHRPLRGRCPSHEAGYLKGEFGSKFKIPPPSNHTC